MKKTLLCMGKEEARNKIDTQIQKGNLLLSKESGKNGLDILNAEYDKWHKFTVQLLIKIFDNEKESREFDATNTMFLKIKPSSTLTGEEGIYNLEQKYLNDARQHLHGKIASGLRHLSYLLEAIENDLFQKYST